MTPALDTLCIPLELNATTTSLSDPKLLCPVYFQMVLQLLQTSLLRQLRTQDLQFILQNLKGNVGLQYKAQDSKHGSVLCGQSLMAVRSKKSAAVSEGCNHVQLST